MNAFDRFLSFFAPKEALKRHAARTRLQLLSEGLRKYEGASKSDRLKLWGASGNSANEEIKSGAAALRYRARDLRRNNPIAARAIQVMSSNVVGTGIKPQFSGRNQRLLKLAEENWKAWGENSSFCDFEENLDIYGMQRLVVESVAESGEVFLVRQRVTNAVGIAPVKIQILESDFLDNEHNETMRNGSKIVQGIEFDSRGRRVAYHFYKTHPGESTTLEKQRVPAERVRHVYLKQRPHQIRGVTFLHPVMIRLKDLDLFQDASLRKQQISACFSAFIYNATGEDLATVGDPKKDWELLEKLDSGTIEELPPGYDVKFADPPSSEFYPDFVKQELLSIASGLGITYEALTQDYSNSNYSSSRMGFIEFHRNIKRWQSELVINQMMQGVFAWFQDALQFSTPDDLNVNRLDVFWTTPGREMIDPGKEIGASRDAVKAGFKTVSEVLRQSGYDPSQVFEERQKELEKMKELGIPADTDPTLGKNSNGGSDANSQGSNQNA